MVRSMATRIRLPGVNLSDLSQLNKHKYGKDASLQEVVCNVYSQDSVQIGIACLIMLNFVFSIIVAQVSPGPGEEPLVFLIFEHLFTWAFFLELMFNMYGHLGKGFWSSYWNVFDFIVVFTSIISMFVNSLPGFTALRLLRAFRVIRLFRRVPSLRIVITAMIASLNAVSSVFIILFLVLGIWSILGVNFFSEDFPEEFGSFFPALMTCFQMMTFDAWGDIARPVISKLGGIAAVYFVSLLFAASIILMNIVVAALLDRFLVTQEKEREENEVKSPKNSQKSASVFTAATGSDALPQRPGEKLPGLLDADLTVEDVEQSHETHEAFHEGKQQGGKRQGEGPGIKTVPPAVPQAVAKQSALIKCPLCHHTVDIPQQPAVGYAAPVAKKDYAVQAENVVGKGSDKIRTGLSRVNALLRPHHQESKQFLHEMREEVAKEKQEQWLKLNATDGKSWLEEQCFLIYNSTKVQIGLAVIIFLNFGVAIVEAQMHPLSPPEKQTFGTIELAFNIVFLVELLVNIKGHYFLPFWKNPWNVFDFCVVVISWLSMGISSLPGLSVLRLFRAFRILRLARRVPILRKLILGVMATISPTLNAFAILCLVLGIWSILGVGFFSEGFPDEFGDFVFASLTCLQILTFDAWASDVARPIMREYGTVYVLYFLSFIFIATILLTNIIVIVLIENYIAATGTNKMGADDVFEAWRKTEKKLMSQLGRIEEALKENNLRYALPQIMQEQRFSAIQAAAKICGPLILDADGNPKKSNFMTPSVVKVSTDRHQIDDTGDAKKEIEMELAQPSVRQLPALSNSSPESDTLAVYSSRPNQ